MPYKLISRLADTVGDGSGIKSGIGDFSSVSRILSLTAQPGEHWQIHRMILGMQAGTIANGAVYAGGAQLANGIAVYVTDSLGVLQYDLTDPDQLIVNNGDWAHYCYDFAVYGSDLPTGDDFAAARWTFAKSGQPIELLPGWSINILLQDDLDLTTSGLVTHQFLMQGSYFIPTIGKDAGHA